ncbi:MAG: (2Fe-2S)-binding protein [Spirochaetaceae bacterium]|nr:MAG: (2Fe-2S)-binding protein [Spirochaetaceae bacterium]
MKTYRGPVKLTLRVNGEERVVLVDPAETLLRTVRRGLGLTGTKAGCENGDCGSCTVQLEGVPVKSCCTLTVDAADRAITTIEGLKDTPIQEGFRREYGFQCGFCTSGFIMNAEAFLRSGRRLSPTAEEDWLQSNICRCTGYEGIRNAMRFPGRPAL